MQFMWDLKKIKLLHYALTVNKEVLKVVTCSFPLIRKIKVYLRYKTITRVSSEAQVRNGFISWRNYLLLQIFKF